MNPKSPLGLVSGERIPTTDTILRNVTYQSKKGRKRKVINGTKNLRYTTIRIRDIKLRRFVFSTFGTQDI